MLAGTPFRFAGMNMYWLALTEDGGVHFPSHAWIDSAMDNAQTMGATVVRTHGVVSVGCSLCIEPDLGVINPNAFDGLDYAVAAAKRRNIRLVMPLVDNYQYFQGGRLTYLSWRGILADSQGSQFFTNSTVLGDFEQHIAAVLNHVNPYTGLAYKNDPAILAWETGNELSVYPATWTYSGWTDQVSRYIKLTLGARQLVMDGKYGIYSLNSTVDVASLQLPYVDIFSNHAYDNYRPPVEIVAESNTVHGYGKAFVIGEYSWTDRDVSGNPLSWTLPQMLLAVEQAGVNGDLFWELLPNGVSHNDGFTLHWPGDTADMQTRARELQAHAFVMCPSSGVCRTQ